jgi:hypothetical protein
MSFGSGRREINWDGVADALSSPNSFPGDFFNGNAAPRARGIVFTTPGSGFEVSADSSNPTNTPPEYAHINPSYAATFNVFTPERLFTPIGSTITDAVFFLPSDQVTPATVSGFGAVFTDVDTFGSSKLDFFDSANQLIYSHNVPAAVGDETLAFLGVHFNAGEQVARVRITSGNTPLGANTLDNPASGVDLVVMDDFIYGEPVPEPGTALLLAAAWPLLRHRRRTRRCSN